ADDRLDPSGAALSSDLGIARSEPGYYAAYGRRRAHGHLLLKSDDVARDCRRAEHRIPLVRAGRTARHRGPRGSDVRVYQGFGCVAVAFRRALVGGDF